MSRIVEFAGQEATGIALNATEKSILNRHVLKHLAWSNSFLQDLFSESMLYLEGAVQVAKEKFDAPFKGLLAGDNEIGIQLIRPGHILRTTGTTETCSNTWSFDFSSGGDYYVGYSTNNTTAVNIDKEALLVILGVAFTQGVAPMVEELYWQIGQTTFPVIVLRSAWLADNRNQVRACRHHPLLLEPKQTALAQPYSLAASTNELVFLGVTMGYGRYLRKTSYSTVSL